MKESLQVQWHGMEGSWPTDETLPGFRQGTKDFMEACQKLSKQLLAVLAIALKLPEDIFTKVSNTLLCFQSVFCHAIVHCEVFQASTVQAN